MTAHLYVILMIAGTPGMTMQWANDEMGSCAQHIPEISADLDKTFADPAKVAKLREEVPGVRREDVRWTCEMHTADTLPKLKNPTRVTP